MQNKTGRTNCIGVIFLFSKTIYPPPSGCLWSLSSAFICDFLMWSRVITAIQQSVSLLEAALPLLEVIHILFNPHVEKLNK